MKIDDVKVMAEREFEKLLVALQAGQSEGLSAYLKAMARLRKYSQRNLLLIFGQRPTATNVMGFQAWKKQGRSVKKGEKGIIILAPLVTSASNAEGADIEVRGFRTAYVFDIEQTEGEELPSLAKVSGEPGSYLLKLKALIESRGITLGYLDCLGGADGVSEGGRITLRSGMEPAQEFSVLVHELAHEMLHHGPDRKEFSRLTREVQAEAISAVVCEALSLSVVSAASDYIQLYSGSAQTLKASLEVVQKTAATLLEELTRGG